MSQQKQLKQPRRDYLRAYVLACVRDNVFSWSDLASPDIAGKLLGAISSDIREVVGELLRTGAANAIGMFGSFLMTKTNKSRG